MNNFLKNIISAPALLLIFVFFYCPCFAQLSVNTTMPVKNLTDAFYLKIDKAESTNKNVFIELEIKDITNKPIIFIRTPIFDVIDHTQYVNLNQFNQLNFSIGSYEVLSKPEPGRYYLSISVFDNLTRIRLANLENLVLIDSSIASKIKSKAKKIEYNMEVRNLNNFQVLDNSLNENPNFSRLEIIPKLSVFEIPISANITFEKNWLTDTKFHLENYNIEFDYNVFKKKIIELAKQKLDTVLKKNNVDSLGDLRNLGYTSITGRNQDWNALIKVYKNDSIRKLMNKAVAYNKIDSIIAVDSISKKYSEVNDSLSVLKKRLTDSLIDTSSAAYKKIKKAYEYYSVVNKNYKQLLQSKEKYDQIKDQYAEVYNNKESLDEISHINPLENVNQNNFLESFVDSKYFDKKTKFLYGLKKFKLGTSILNGNNQSTNGILINGLNLSYKYKKIYTHIFAGIKSDKIFFNKNAFKNKDKSIGFTIGFGQENNKNVEVYYNYFENSILNDFIRKDKNHLFGFSGNYTFKKIFLLGFENAYIIKNNDINELGYFLKGRAYYQKDKLTFSQEVLYKSDHYHNNNLTSYTPENLLLTSNIETKIFNNSIDVKANNIFSKRFKSDSTFFNFSNLSTVTINYLNKKKPYSLLVNANYFIAKYNDINKRSNVIQTTISNNYLFKHNKYNHSINLAYNILYNQSFINNIVRSEAILISILTPNKYTQHQVSLTQSVNFLKDNLLINRSSGNLIKYGRDSLRQSVSTEFTYIKSNIKYFKPQISVMYEYFNIAKTNTHSINITLNPVFTFKKYFYLSVLASYTRNKIINNEVKQNDLRLQTSIILKY